MFCSSWSLTGQGRCEGKHELEPFHKECMDNPNVWITINTDENSTYTQKPLYEHLEFNFNERPKR